MTSVHFRKCAAIKIHALQTKVLPMSFTIGSNDLIVKMCKTVILLADIPSPLLIKLLILNASGIRLWFIA